jgi:hypothetical protein
MHGDFLPSTSSERPPPDLHALARHIEAAFKSLNIAIDPDSRVGQYLKTTGSGDYINQDDPRFLIAVQGSKDLQELNFIIEILGGKLEENRRKKRLTKIAIQDPALLGPATEHSTGRDMVFELLIESILTRAGMLPVLVDPPDYVCTLGEERIAVECKRVKSEDKLIKRIAEAFDRLDESVQAGSCSFGIVAIDVAFVFNPEQHRLRSRMSDSQLYSRWKRQMDTVTGPIVERARELRCGRPIRGIIFLDSIIQWLPNDYWIPLNLWYLASLDDYNARRQREFERFAELFKSGIPALEDPSQI